MKTVGFNPKGTAFVGFLLTKGDALLSKTVKTKALVTLPHTVSRSFPAFPGHPQATGALLQTAGLICASAQCVSHKSCSAFGCLPELG